MLSCKTEGKLYVGGTSLHKEQAIGNEAHSHLFFLKKKQRRFKIPFCHVIIFRFYQFVHTGQTN
jgi:hypothetical protein